MPITPFNRADLLVALLRAKRPRVSFMEQDWLQSLEPFNYADPHQLLRDAIREGLLVQDFRYKNQDRYSLADDAREHIPVAHFHEGFCARANRPPLPLSTRRPQPRAKPLPPTAYLYKALWQDPPLTPPGFVYTRVSYFRSPLRERLPDLPIVPPSPTTWPKHQDVTLHQVYQAVASPPARLVRATALAAALQGSPWEPLATGCLDYVSFEGVWTPEQGLTETTPWIALLLTMDPALPFEQIRLELLSDRQLQAPLLLLYGHPGRHQFVAVLEQPLGSHDTPAAQYLDYFAGCYGSRGLRGDLLPGDERGLALCPVWYDPKAYLNRALWPVETPQ